MALSCRIYLRNFSLFSTVNSSATVSSEIKIMPCLAKKIEHSLKIFVRTDAETDKNIGTNNNPHHKSSFNDAMSASCSAAVMPRVAASCCNFLAIIDKLGQPTIRRTISSSGISASASLISLAVPWITVACVVMIFAHSRANPSIIHD